MTFIVVYSQGLHRIRRPDGGRIPLHPSGAEYCCENEHDISELIAVARRNKVLYK